MVYCILLHQGFTIVSSCIVRFLNKFPKTIHIAILAIQCKDFLDILNEFKINNSFYRRW